MPFSKYISELVNGCCFKILMTSMTCQIFCPCMLSCWVSCIWNPILLLTWKQKKWRKFCRMRLSSNHLVYIMLSIMCLVTTKQSCLHTFWDYFLFLLLVHYIISSWKQYAFYIESGFHYSWFLCMSQFYWSLVIFFNNQPDALIIQIYSVIKLYMFRASSLPIIRSFLLYIRHD